uniref:Undecaprenyl-phosphate 4-deoxy-4-formamido-L-arabinose transferase n=1 Tax=Curvibacter symbiont subsp. Hydra magnipapillata TaxID=667019 RepID=C9Y605_CURXX|nr:hypothetical protein Csp_E33820 [Curvibacter putative symbiont of Hydra magnipapillata]
MFRMEALEFCIGRHHKLQHITIEILVLSGWSGALVSLLYALFIVIRTVVFGVDLPGYASLLVATIFFGSVQLISVGMLGEYIGRIYMESKRRPLYIVRRRHDSQG